MSNSALTEDERNRLADLVASRGGDELLIAEVLTWAEGVRTGADQLELVLRGFLAPTMGDGGQLALIPLHLAVPASSPALDFTMPRPKLQAMQSGECALVARRVVCPECAAGVDEPCCTPMGDSSAVHARRYDRALQQSDSYALTGVRS